MINTEKQLIEFLETKQADYNEMLLLFCSIFNEVGNQDKTGKSQEAFVVLLILTILKSSNMPLHIQRDAVKQALKRVGKQ